MPRRTKSASTAPPAEETAPAETPAEETANEAPAEETPTEGNDEFVAETTENSETPTETEEAPADTAEARKARREARKKAKAEETTTESDTASANEEPAKPAPVASIAPQALVNTVPLDEQDDYLKGLWYGVGGTGKTTDMLTVTKLPDEGKILVINAEAGLKPSALRQHGIDTSRITTWPDTRAGETLTYEGLEAVFNTVSADLAKDPDSWCATVWDSGTEIVQLLLDDKVLTAYNAQEERIRKSTAGRPGNARGRFQTEAEDYGAVGQEVKYLIRKFKFLPAHFLWSCLERSFDDKDTGRSRIGPNVNPALAAQMIGYFDVVIRTAVWVDENNRSTWTGRTAPSQHEEAKDRYSALPINMVDPTVERIYQYIAGTLTEENDPAREGTGVESALRNTENRATTGKATSARKSRTKKADEKPAETETADAAASA